MLGIYWRLEARGEIRGGRFVDGFNAEQFALPEAVEALRAIRRQRDQREMVLVAAAGPLNLVGILIPGSRISPLSGRAILYENGIAVHIGEAHTLQTKLREVSLCRDELARWPGHPGHEEKQNGRRWGRGES